MISQEIRSMQSRYINKIIDRIKNNGQKFLTFKAPTGSGKTYMMLELMNKIIKNDENAIFIVSSLSTNGLANQTFNVFKRNSHNFHHLKIGTDVIGSNKTGFMYIEPNLNVYVLPIDKYKKDSLLKDGPNGDILKDFFDNKKYQNKKLYLIKDESHRATKNLEKLEYYFDFILNFSATPKKKPDVELPINECVENNLIKRIDKLSGELDDYGISEYKKIKKEYEKYKIPCNPALIIQISNSKNGENECEKIKKFLPTLDKIQQYAKDVNLQWVIIGDKKNKKVNLTNNKDLLQLPREEWTKELAKPLCPISIIIFKLIIKEGYDIPRACMLYQVRDTKSKILDEQVIGRIRRNPLLKNFDQYSKNVQNLVLLAKAWGIFDKSEDNYKIDLILKKVEKFKFKLKTSKINNQWLSSKQKNHLDLEKILQNKKLEKDKSIFELNKKWEKIIVNGDDIIAIKKKIKSDEQWFLVMSNLEFIKNENEKQLKNYDESIIIETEEHGFLDQTYCWNQKNNTNLISSEDDFCPYNRRNSIDKMLPLESKAENDFFHDVKKYFNTYHHLNDIKIFGKNFYLSDRNNAIKYGYVNDGIRTTYPDFIIQYRNIFYIIEIKSDEKNGRFDYEQQKKYHQKCNAIIEAYKATSKKIPKYVFAVVVKENGNNRSWRIYKSINGKQMRYDNISNLFD